MTSEGLIFLDCRKFYQIRKPILYWQYTVYYGILAIYVYYIPCEETSNVYYHFRWECGSHYNGHTARLLLKRMGEHFSPPSPQLPQSKSVYRHIRTFERRKTEAFYIRVKRPDQNDQTEHNFSKVF